MLVRRRRSARPIIAWAAVILVIAGAASGAVIYIRANASPVPKNFSQQFAFPIYYPDQRKLPEGYALNTGSFTSPDAGVVLYSIKYGQNKKIVVSDQKKPSDQEMQQFNLNYIPLRTAYSTKIGQAQIGAFNNGKAIQTIVSLPAKNSNGWLIITAPADINQNDLKQVLSSLKQ